MPALHDACLRHARYYLTVLWEADRQYHQGQAAFKRALALFDAEWLNVAAAQLWLAEHLEDNEAAALCSDYPNAAIYLLSMRLVPSERIRWLKAASDAALRVNNLEAKSWHTGNLGRIYRELGDTQKATDC